MTSRSKRWPVLSAACWLLGSLGCAQQVTTTDNSTGTTSNTGGGGAGGTGGSIGTGGVPDTCTQQSDCAALDGNCIEGACVDAKCTTLPAPDFGSCDDGNPCTMNDQCSAGQCSGAPISCGAAPPCKIEICNPATGNCEEQPGDNGAQCDDGDPCTYFGTCNNGTCAKGTTIDCSFLNSDCSVGYCDPVGGCKTKPAADGFACDDGMFCTINETCSNGECTNGIPMPCAPPGGCFVAACDEANDTCTAAPGNDGNPCDDGSPCTANTTCTNGACINGTPANEGIACDDGTSCTVGEFCSAGICGGGTGPQVFFADDFSDNSAGWVLGPEWQIGPAKMGFNMGFSGPDPENDHTATADDGVAGVIIGGEASPVPHDYYFIESPTFDTSFASGSIILGYYRWLNSDSDPGMHNRIDVWNGNQWITVWASGDFFFEASWSFQQIDVTAYKNPAMRIRFGFDVGDFAFGTYSSWNIDDVLVASQACP